MRDCYWMRESSAGKRGRGDEVRKTGREMQEGRKGVTKGISGRDLGGLLKRSRGLVRGTQGMEGIIGAREGGAGDCKEGCGLADSARLHHDSVKAWPGHGFHHLL